MAMFAILILAAAASAPQCLQVHYRADGSVEESWVADRGGAVTARSGSGSAYSSARSKSNSGASASSQIMLDMSGAGGSIDFTTRMAGAHGIWVNDAGLTSAVTVTGSANNDIFTYNSTGQMLEYVSSGGVPQRPPVEPRREERSRRHRHRGRHHQPARRDSRVTA